MTALDDVTFVLTNHAKRQAEAKGFTRAEIQAAAVDPEVRYPSLRVRHQERRIRGRVCAVVDPIECVVVTVYLHNVRTPLRPDQMTDAEALRSDRKAHQ